MRNPRVKEEHLWYLPSWANRKFEAYLKQLQDPGITEDEALGVHEDIRRLPNFPRDSARYSLIRRQITTMSSSDVH